MCGIMGYVGKRQAAGIVYEGLKALEYRGYDSAGLAIKGDEIMTVKKKGRVTALEEHVGSLSGGIGIGHTRWATHGKPSDINAHPHTSGEITLVHNGIIENYLEIKCELERKGVRFVSDTDSEVVAALIGTYYGGNLLEAVQRATQMLIGSYALLVISSDFDGIVVAKKHSPVIIGLGKNENFCASDMPALCSLSRELIILSDGDFAEITRESVTVYDSALNAVDRGIYAGELTSMDLKLGNNPHYMYKEMHESRMTVERTAESFLQLRPKIREILSGAERIVLTGCGTAYHAAMLGARYLEMYTDYIVYVEVAGELRYRKIKGEGILLIAVTQSGETADTVEAARVYKEGGARVLAVTNCPFSAISTVADFCLPVVAGSEISVAATKSYLGQITALYLLAKGVDQGICADLQAVLPQIDEALLVNVELLAQVARSSKGVYFLGRDLDFVSAKEGSLKLKEISYIQCEGYLSSELKHGTLAIVDNSILCIFLITQRALAEKSINAVEQVLSRGGKVAVITTIEEVRQRLYKRVLVKKLLCSSDELSPLVVGVVLQKIAYRTSLLCGYDPDKPRNLAKSVTVE